MIFFENNLIESRPKSLRLQVLPIIQDYQVWGELPTKAPEWKGEVIEYSKSSIEYKRILIAELASTLMKNRLVMSGQELQ